MRTLVVLLLMCAPTSADDFRWNVEVPFFDWTVTAPEGGDASPSQDAAVRATDGPSFVHRINVVNRGGSATCIAPGVFITCKHIFEGLRGYQVSIDGQAVAASVTLSTDQDVAIVVIGSEAAAAPFASESPAYLAECVAFGHGSKALHHGFISNDDTLSLDADASGIEQGDSGGAVFCDGVLVGVIRGKNPGNARVCYFTPLSAVADLLKSTVGAPADASPVAAEPPAAPGENKPSITIVSPATWDCPHCPTHRDQDWSGFDVIFVNRDGLPLYPATEWVDKRGVTRRLYGKYTPKQVMWSWERTQ